MYTTLCSEKKWYILFLNITSQLLETVSLQFLVNITEYIVYKYIIL